jgi:pimeloyl-ACP methyl ester carboxylesterase
MSEAAHFTARARRRSQTTKRRAGVTPIALGAAALAALAAPGFVRAQEAEAVKNAEAATQPTPTKSGRIAANGVNYYYEIHGRGEPLLLLHGGLGSIDMFGPLLPVLSRGREIIAVDLHGHGRTQLGNRKINLIDIGDDLGVILEELGYEQVDVLGYSFGAGAGFRFAVQHPGKVRRLALVSGGFAQKGFYPELLPMQAQVGAAMAEQMKGTPMYQSYMAVAPDPDEFPKLLDNMGELMRTPYNWAEDVGKLRMPVMLVYGDSDMYRLEHVVEFYHLLGGGQKDAGWQREHMSQNRLAILPGLTHYEIFLAPALTATVLPFLNDEMAKPSWGEQAGQGQQEP